MSDSETTVEPGYCHCGCGEKAGVYAATNAKYGSVKGAPKKFAHGHNPRVPIAKRLFAKVDKTAPNGCWEWRGYKCKGYGQIGGPGGKNVLVHRVSYELTKGPIPEGLVIDHLCRNRACVNPDHLEAVTFHENVLRGDAVGPRTHCRRGHALTPENTYVNPSNQRSCRICKAAAHRRRRQRLPQ